MTGMAFGALANLADGNPPPDYVMRLAARGFGVSIYDFRDRAKTRPLATYRLVAMAAERILCGSSFPAIAANFNRKDHTTAMSALYRCRTDPSLARSLEALVYAVRKQWAIDTGTEPPIPGQQVIDWSEQPETGDE